MESDDEKLSRPQAPSEEERQRQAKRRRTRRMLTYGGAGGGTIAIMIWAYFFFFAAVVYHTVDDALKEVGRRHPRAAIKRDRTTGYVTTMSNLESSSSQTERIGGAAAGSFAVGFLQQPAVAAVLGVPKDAELRVVGRSADPQLDDYDIVRIQQFVDHVRLFGADIAVSVRREPSAAINAVATRPATVPAMDMAAKIDEPAARTIATKHYASMAEDVRNRLNRDEPIQESERVVFDPKRFGLTGDAALAWRVRLDSVQVFVDAKTGQIILAYDDRPTVLNRLTHDCKKTADCPLVLKEAGPVPPLNPLGADARQAHAAMAAVHGYFKTTFGRDGFDDALGTGGAAAIESFVQVRDFGNANARWISRTRRFEFSVGWTTLDISAHEYTHAVTSFGPALEYLGESGAVSEFFSDFFAAMVERNVARTTDWRIGEGLPGHSAAKPLRNMADPHNGGFDPTKGYNAATNAGQPQHFSEVVRPDQTICNSVGGDNGCVHFNSGILSKALVLAIDGGSFQGTAVAPIARAKVEQIMFRTLLLGGVITQSSNLQDTANGAVVSCTQLVGSPFGITDADCTAFAKAFAAVGLPVTP